MRFAVNAIFSTLVVFATCGSPCFAGFTFLGPTPYLSAADSPFAQYLDGPDFYLEDFEDGELNTPGIFQPIVSVFGTSDHGVVVGPSALTDSVDGDDGVIDGLGIGGHSFRTNSHLTAPTLPPQQVFSVQFEFNAMQLGHLPTAFGFVWTDGFRGSSAGFTVTNANGKEQRFSSPRPMGDGTRGGVTYEDQFLGVFSEFGITKVRISGGYVGATGFDFIEIDHLQYGIVVPEPKGTIPLVLASVLSFFGRKRLWH